MSSTGLPTRLVSRAARLGCSSDLTAFRSASRSSSVISEVSCNDNSFLQHVCSFPIAKTYPSYGRARNNGRALWRCRVVGPFLQVAMLVAFTDCARRQQIPDGPALNCPKCLPALSCRGHRASLRREVNPATGRFVPRRDVASSRLGGRL